MIVNKRKWLTNPANSFVMFLLAVFARRARVWEGVGNLLVGKLVEIKKKI